jgi:hypothetical protein
MKTLWHSTKTALVMVFAANLLACGARPDWGSSGPSAREDAAIAQDIERGLSSPGEQTASYPGTLTPKGSWNVHQEPVESWFTIEFVDESGARQVRIVGASFQEGGVSYVDGIELKVDRGTWTSEQVGAALGRDFSGKATATSESASSARSVHPTFDPTPLIVGCGAALINVSIQLGALAYMVNAALQNQVKKVDPPQEVGTNCQR